MTDAQNGQPTTTGDGAQRTAQGSSDQGSSDAQSGGTQPGNPDQRPPYSAVPPPPPVPAPGDTMKVADIVEGQPDNTGSKVDTIFARQAAQFAVYNVSHKGVFIHFADAPEEQKAQRERVNAISDLRWKADSLANRRWRDSSYQRELASALVLALTNQAEDARSKLTLLIAALEAESARIGRFQHALSAIGAWALLIGILFLFSDVFHKFDRPNENVWQAGKAGATGALMSVLIAFRGRTQAPDTKLASNILEAFVRIGIGVIAGGVLLVAYASGFVTRPLGGDATNAQVSVTNWQAVVLLGFFAGFVERLVPSLFERTPATPQPPVQAPGGGAQGK